MEAEFTSSKQLFLSMDKMKMRYSSLLVTINMQSYYFAHPNKLLVFLEESQQNIMFFVIGKQIKVIIC